jgi:phosphoglycolate phosphatase-like HAD superfamily hydrolase
MKSQFNKEQQEPEKEIEVKELFNQILTRDFFPFKPDPAASRFICKEWGFEPHEVMFVGDFRDDLLCGGAAGNITCLLNNHLNQQFRNLAHINIKQLDELITHLEEGFEIDDFEKHLQQPDQIN